MTYTQSQILYKLEIEQQVLSSQLQAANNQAMSGTINPVEIQMHGRLEVRLASIERAIIRLKRGTYEVCQSCGEKIDSARLEALPYAEQCIDCQRSLERKAIQGYAYAYPSS